MQILFLQLNQIKWWDGDERSLASENLAAADR